MPKQIFVNLPVKDLKRSTAFFTKLGFAFNPRFTDENASRAQVDELVAKAKAAGGTAPRKPQDHGFMYGHGFEDLDGHIWELVYREPDAGEK